MSSIRVIINTLILVNIILPIYTIFKECVFKNKFQVNHIFLFSMGFMYYWVLPIIIGSKKYFYQRVAMDKWYEIFNQISEITLVKYLLCILCFYIVFIIGSYFGKKRFYNNQRRKCVNFHKGVLNIYLILISIIIVIYIYKFKNNFFTGYIGTITDVSQKGPFIASSIVLFSLFIVYTSKIQCDYKKNINLNKIIFNKFFILYIFVSILILSLGGRLYFISAVMSLFVYKTVYLKKINIKRFLFYMVLIIISMGFLGVMRTGIQNIRGDVAFFNLFQETLYTAFSLIGFLNIGHFYTINFPKFLISEFVNLIPTAILPNKLTYLLNPSDFGYFIFNPLGALNSFVSFLINFGLIGSILVFFIIAIILQRLKKKENSILCRTIYILVSGFLPFTFFRDGFETSLVKNIFEFSILIPIVVVVSTHIISASVVRRR